MPLWIIFSILAALSWAIANTTDKYIVGNWVKNPVVLIIFVGLIGLLAGILIYFIHGFSEMSLRNVLLAFAAGFSYVSMLVFYFRAAKMDEISRVVPLSFLASLFILVFASLFLGEILTMLNYSGVVSLVFGAIIISLKNIHKFKLSGSFWLMVVSSFSFAVYAVITKYLLGEADYWTVFSYIRIGVFIAIIPIIYFNFSELIFFVKKSGKRISGLVSLNETIRLSGGLFITIASSTGSVTLANALAAIQPFFVLFFTIILSAFYPQIIKEENGKSAVVTKLFAITLMFIGAILITY